MSGWQREGRGKSAQAPTSVAGEARLVRPLGQGLRLAHEVRLARSLRLPHALIVEGVRGGGKTTVLEWLAAALLCPSDLDPEEPCGVCRTCVRIASRQHPDLHVLKRAESEAEKEAGKHVKQSFHTISVDQVRDTIGVLAHHAVEGRARIALVLDADTMEEEAQNALLKTLEEPGAATFLLLEAARPERLLPTVRSRVRRLRVLPLEESVLRAEILRRRPDAGPRLESALAVARGSLGLGLLACTEQVVQIHDLVRELLAAPKELRPVATARAALEGADDRRLELGAARTFLWLLRAELQRRIEVLAGGGEAAYGATSTEPWTTWLESTLAAERDLQLQIPPEQVLTACLVEMRAG